MSRLAGLFARWKIRNILFLLLLITGIAPLAISSLLLVSENRDVIKTQEKGYLARSSLFLSLELDGFLVDSRRSLDRLGSLIVALANDEGQRGPISEARLSETFLSKDAREGKWLKSYLETSLAEGGWLGLRVLDSKGNGPYSWPRGLEDSLIEVLGKTYDEAVNTGNSVWRLVDSVENGLPRAVVSTPFEDGDLDGTLVLQGVLELKPLTNVFARETQAGVALFVVDLEGDILWHRGADDATADAVAQSGLVADFIEFPLNMTAEYTLAVDGSETRMVGRISPVDEASWGIVLHKPAATAFRAVEKMILSALISSAVVIVIALVVAGLAARHISRPISHLAESTKEIATGNFAKTVEAVGPGAEIGDLAKDFNLMIGQVRRHVRELERAAQANRELFIGSMRAFVAAVDAKDPYTRGHSERVAAHSRTISRYLGLGSEEQHRIWVGALLHDVGKIGVEDRILRKGGVLSSEEYEQMKQHPAIGAEILSRIEQLREMIPAIRWHHEAWNGQGYPDGRKGEQIPVMARIVAVADTFDAITTSRPYQRAYEVEFALETIRKLAGTRFDAKVVTAFLRAVDAGEVQLRREAVHASASEEEPAATVAT